MPRKRDAEAESHPACAIPGCTQPGAHKAPRSRTNVREYQWLCLEHVREFNRAWDYFDGMSSEEIEEFQRDAVTGHRPTWDREGSLRDAYKRYSAAMQDELRRFFYWGAPPDGKSGKEAEVRALTARERKALATMELDAPCSAAALKAHYRIMVKRYHPDLNPGNRAYEERFKQITAAYAYLAKCYE